MHPKLVDYRIPTVVHTVCIHMCMYICTIRPLPTYVYDSRFAVKDIFRVCSSYPLVVTLEPLLVLLANEAGVVAVVNASTVVNHRKQRISVVLTTLCSMEKVAYWM